MNCAVCGVKQELKLESPTNEYKDQVMEYRRIFLENGESFDGCAGLEECETYEEWIDFDNRLSKNMVKAMFHQMYI